MTRVSRRASRGCSARRARDCVVPKTSAGQGLRAILNTFDPGAARRRDARRVRFARRDPARVRAARPHRADVRRGARRRPLRRRRHRWPRSARRVDLVVVSRGRCSTPGSVLDDVAGDRRARRMRRADACCSTSITRSACCPSTSPRSTSTSRSAAATSICAADRAPASCTCIRAISTASLRTLDTGWFAKREPFAYRRPDPPRAAAGGDAFLESTPPVLTLLPGARRAAVHAGAGRRARCAPIRCAQQRRLVALLARRGVAARAATTDRGAFVVVDRRAAPRH